MLFFPFAEIKIVDDDLIKAIIDSDRHSTTREIAEKLHVLHTCIENHLKHGKGRGAIQLMLLMFINRFCYQFGGIWWDKGIVYFELLPPNRRINSDVYIEQLTKLNNAVKEKRPELTNRKDVVFHHDNTRPTHLWPLGNNYWSLVRMFCHITI
ncbi:transposase [Cooperia oncophora]